MLILWFRKFSLGDIFTHCYNTSSLAKNLCPRDQGTPDLKTIVIATCNEITDATNSRNYTGDMYKVYPQRVHLAAQGVVSLIRDVAMAVTGSQSVTNLQLCHLANPTLTGHTPSMSLYTPCTHVC